VHFDFPLEVLRAHQPALAVPDDFDDFWQRTLVEARAFPIDVRLDPVELGFAALRTYDFSFAGFGGHRIRAWLRVPVTPSDEPMPGFVQFHGYRGGRGLAHEPQIWPHAGFAHLSVDTRGQGGHWMSGSTADPVGGSGPEVAGWLTRGIRSPESTYYRRVYIDAVRAVEALRSIPEVDAARVFIGGGSQGGGIALAAASLLGDLPGVVADVPFLCDFPEALSLATDQSIGYGEVLQYLMLHRGEEENVLRTLSYIDVANLVTRAPSPALVSVALMDPTCMPRTVFAAFNRYAGTDKEMVVYPYNMHEGGGTQQIWRGVEWARARARTPAQVRSAG
jgi:cephalosporin-C deacetylase